MEEFAKAAPYPVATSLSYEIYKLLPNDTDFTIFKDAGLSGFNFSYIDGYAYYHSAIDSVETIDERSLQHHGSYMLALTRHFADLNLENPKGYDLVYFNIPGAGLLTYSPANGVLFTAAIALLFLLVVGLGLRKRKLTILGMSLGAFFLFSAMVVSSAVVTLLWWSI
jgi:hypothetical protein